MIAPGLNSMDEPDRVEREEEARKQTDPGRATASEVGPFSFDCSAVSLDPTLDPSTVLADLDFGDGTF
ncbi:hypothetical protein AAE478_006211 [Parahypoxylon ruwenzoriense]